MLHGLEDLRVKQFTFEQTIKFPLSKTATFATHALPDALVFEHALVQLVMVVPTLSARSRCTSASRSSSTSLQWLPWPKPLLPRPYSSTEKSLPAPSPGKYAPSLELVCAGCETLRCFTILQVLLEPGDRDHILSGVFNTNFCRRTPELVE